MDRDLWGSRRLNDITEPVDSSVCKVEKTCRSCGNTFVSYSYHKLVRCDECRARNRGEGAP